MKNDFVDDLCNFLQFIHGLDEFPDPLAHEGIILNAVEQNAASLLQQVTDNPALLHEEGFVDFFTQVLSVFIKTLFETVPEPIHDV